jgi:hypothetical protein
VPGPAFLSPPIYSRSTHTDAARLVHRRAPRWSSSTQPDPPLPRPHRRSGQLLRQPGRHRPRHCRCCLNGVAAALVGPHARLASALVGPFIVYLASALVGLPGPPSCSASEASSHPHQARLWPCLAPTRTTSPPPPSAARPVSSIDKLRWKYKIQI